MYEPQTQSQQAVESNLEPNPAFDELLAYLRQSHGFSFRDYKPASVMRRIQVRMQQVGIDSYSEYTAYLQAHPDEFEPLFNTIEINVTDFFRDPYAWQYLVAKIIPRLCQEKGADKAIRAWSAGCASGEEAYSLAIALAEELGMEQYQKRVRIFASDVDAEALNQARQGHYSAMKMADMPVVFRERYFEPVGNDYSVCSKLRSPLIFFRHNLLEDPPMSNIDLLLCRNALIYFNHDGQTKTLVRFYFSLNRNGVLFLGNSEALPLGNELFKPLSVKHHMLSKADKSCLTSVLLAQGLKRSPRLGA